MKVIYVETCPRCFCAVARSPEAEFPGEEARGVAPGGAPETVTDHGAIAGSSYLKATCGGCTCHGDLPIASGT